ncbi:MAG: hypothetical protein JXR83_10115, partial [Deltaproteobacteria bacterium]|nr:hypothetical protein [Deltaproteobacteria bacterium]
GVCLPVGAGCDSDEDCLGVEACVDGRCRLTCLSGADCPADQVCCGGLCETRCQPNPDAALADGAVDDGAVDDGARHDARAPDAAGSDRSGPDLWRPADAARDDAWECPTVECGVAGQCCVDSCAVARGAPCSGGYCDGSGDCVACLADAHCSDSDRCTLDVCLGDNTCRSSNARQSIALTTEFGRDGFCTNGVTLGYQRVEAACYNYAPDPLKNSRGFLSFDTSAVPDGAQINSVDLTLCRTGGPGAQEAELYSTSFGLNLTCSAYDSPVVYLRSLPNGSGPVTVVVSPAAVDASGPSQFQIRYPVTDCGAESWAGKRWLSATGPTDTNCHLDDIPGLEVEYCTAPY